MTKLNTLITKESGLREALQQGAVLMESDFIQALKVSKSQLFVFLRFKNLFDIFMSVLPLPGRLKSTEMETTTS